MAPETADLHKNESHTGLYAAAAVAAGLALAGAALYVSKGRAAEALPEVEGTFGLSRIGQRFLPDLAPLPSFFDDAAMLEKSRWMQIAHTAKTELESELHGVPRLNIDMRDFAGSRLNADVSDFLPNSSRLLVGHGDVSEVQGFDLAAFFRLCEKAPAGLTKLRVTGAAGGYEYTLPLNASQLVRPIAVNRGVATLSDEALSAGNFATARIEHPFLDAIETRHGYAVLSPAADISTNFPTQARYFKF